jgi:hypothetical protein
MDVRLDRGDIVLYGQYYARYLDKRAVKKAAPRRLQEEREREGRRAEKPQIPISAALLNR